MLCWCFQAIFYVAEVSISLASNYVIGHHVTCNNWNMNADIKRNYKRVLQCRLEAQIVIVVIAGNYTAFHSAINMLILIRLLCFDARCWLGGRKGIRFVKTE